MDPLSEPLLKITEEVEDAIAEQRPLVALESTLLAHGLPEDVREKVAHLLEQTVRDEGATPATISIIDREFCIGASADQFARLLNDHPQKASLRDLAPALVLGGVWATTVASTMAIAAQAGIKLFATGGIGGVHRGAAQSFDESADLTALKKYGVGVVSAGVKSVLDLSATMERLETLGVPVIGFKTDQLPAFYHAESGLSLACHTNEEAQLARILYTQLHRLEGGGLLVVQAPPEETAQDPKIIEPLIEDALKQASKAGIKGKAVTPFLLAALDKASAGDVVKTNVALVENNARLAARIAVEEQKLRAQLTGQGMVV